jgi:DNA polymerase III delta prime subunit
MPNDTLKESWTEEFAPKTLDDMVLSKEIKDRIRGLLASKTRFSCTFAGEAGIGKTTVAKLIARELDASVLFVQCGIEGTVSTAQGKVKRFCEPMSMEGKPKVVILDELDSASGTQDNSFQKTMRNIISESPDTMFIGTCNYVEKVIEPIRSRMRIVSLKFSARDLLERVKSILDTKGIRYTRDSLRDFVDNTLRRNYPDIRRIISILQSSCSTGDLVVEKAGNGTEDADLANAIIEKAFSSEGILDVRKFYLQEKSKIDDYRTLAGTIFNRVLDSGKVSDPRTILKASDIIYQMNVVIDPEIQFFALLTLFNGAKK